MIDEFDVSEAFEDLEQSYPFTRYTVSNVSGRDVKTPSAPVNIECYIHPHDMKSDIYDGNEYRTTSFIKVFARISYDIKPEDEVPYMGDTYRIMKGSKRIVGNHQKWIGEML